MGFKDLLKEALRQILPEETLQLLPRGYQILGKTIILKLNENLLKYKELIGKMCLEIIPSIESIYLNSGTIKGTFRTPEKIEFLAGKDNPIVEHLEQ